MLCTVEHYKDTQLVRKTHMYQANTLIETQMITCKYHFYP